MMDIKVYLNRGVMLVQLIGRVVLDECDRIKQSILPLMAREVSMINLDLSRVDFIDSAGLGVLLALKTNATKTRSGLALLSPSTGVADILVVSKLESVFDIITGPDATSRITALAHPQFLVGAGAAPAMPSPAMRGPAMPANSPMDMLPTDGPLSDKQRIDQLCKQAVEHMRQGDYESAADAYTKALEIDPEYLPAHNNLAIVYEKKPQWQAKAIKAWERVEDIASRRNDAKHIDRAQKHLANLNRLSSS